MMIEITPADASNLPEIVLHFHYKMADDHAMND